MKKFKVGSIVFSVAEVPSHHSLKHFFRQPMPESSEVDVHFEVSYIEKPTWVHCQSFQKDGVWRIGRLGHAIGYKKVTNTISLCLIPELEDEALYWLKRDLIGAFGSISGSPLLHSSSVISDNKAYIFSATSGTGKSTLYANLEGFVERVNDESNWVYQVDGQYVMLNHNFYFGLSDTSEVPVGDIFILDRAKKSYIEENCPDLEAYKLLLSIAPPFDNYDPFLETRSKAVMKLIKDLPIKKFYASLDRSDLKAALGF